MGLKFRRGTTAQKSGSLAFGEPYVNTTLGTLEIGGESADIVLSAVGTGSNLLINNITASHIIPALANTYDLGSETNYWRDLYISTGSIKFVAGGAVVGTIMSGSSATTGSNIFIGNQTITGSLYVSQNLYVQGTSSIQNITASAVSIGTNTVVLNTSTPTVRFGGISVIDSGSNAGTGSLWWDSLENHWVYEHPEDSGAPYNSAMLISGPKNSGSLGDEIGLTLGQVPVAVGDDHIGDSIISASATKVTVAGDLDVTGNVSASTISGIGNVTDYSSSIATRLVAAESFSSSLDATFATDASVTSLSSSVKAVTDTFATSASVASATATSISTLSGSVFTTYAKLAGANTFTTNQIISGSLSVTGDVVAYSTSDKRHKNNIVVISDALSKVTKLNGVTWEWNDDVDVVTKETPKTGLIAQEVQEVLPEVVKERADGFLSLDYSKMMGLMVEAIKEQQQQIHSLTLEIENLKKNNSL
jgi:hypothetical protein